MGDLLVHDRVIARLQDGEIVDALLHSSNLVLQLFLAVVLLAELLQKLLILLHNFLTYPFFLLQLLLQLLDLNLVFRDLLALLFEVIFGVRLQLLPHLVPLPLLSLVVLPDLIVLPRLLLPLLLNFFLFLPSVTQLRLQQHVLFVEH